MDLNPRDLNYSSNMKNKATFNCNQSSLLKNKNVNKNLNKQIQGDSELKKNIFLFKKDVNRDVKTNQHNYRTSKNSRNNINNFS